MSRLALVGDIGGTNARFGLANLDAEELLVQETSGYVCRDFPRAQDAIRTYLRDREVTTPPAAAIIAVAGPVKDGEIHFTNSDWHLSVDGLNGLGIRSARLINDYSALALAAPMLASEDSRVIGPDLPVLANKTIAVLGPGTGFGVSALVRDEFGGEVTLATEGGHICFAPGDEIEVEILRRLMAKYGRVSVERILSGPGLCDLHQALAAMDGRVTDLVDPAELTERAFAGDRHCLESVERFCAILGCVAGDFALAFGATGGVYVAGGIPPLLLPILEKSTFRARFENKGRFGDYLSKIPTRVITRPHVALLGAARAALEAVL